MAHHVHSTEELAADIRMTAGDQFRGEISETFQAGDGQAFTIATLAGRRFKVTVTEMEGGNLAELGGNDSDEYAEGWKHYSPADLESDSFG